MPSSYSSLMCVHFCFPDIDIVLILRVPKALINMEACMEQKIKCPQRISSLFVERNKFFPSSSPFLNVSALLLLLHLPRPGKNQFKLNI